MEAFLFTQRAGCSFGRTKLGRPYEKLQRAFLSGAIRILFKTLFQRYVDYCSIDGLYDFVSLVALELVQKQGVRQKHLSSERNGSKTSHSNLFPMTQG